jgi:hypothetical protein
MSDQLVAEAATYTTRNQDKRRTSMPSAGFEPKIPEIEWSQTDALDLTATRVVSFTLIVLHIADLSGSAV